MNTEHCIIYFSATYIQQAKKSYTDTRTRKNIHNINYELQDVQRIMVQNIDDVLQRGQALSGQRKRDFNNLKTQHVPEYKSLKDTPE